MPIRACARPDVLVCVRSCVFELVHDQACVNRTLFTLFTLLAYLNYTLQTPNRSTEPSDFS